MKTLSIASLTLFLGLALTTPSVQAAGFPFPQGNRRIDANPQLPPGANIPVGRTRYVVTYFSAGAKRCFRNEADARRYEVARIQSGYRAVTRRIQRGVYCVYYYFPKRTRSFDNKADARRFRQILTNLGFSVTSQVFYVPIQ